MTTSGCPRPLAVIIQNGKQSPSWIEGEEMPAECVAALARLRDHRATLRAVGARRFADEIRQRYGVRAEVKAGRVVMAKREWAIFERAVWADRSIDAVGRGYYLGTQEFDIRPDWMFDPLSIAWARLIAALTITLRLRQLTRWLDRHATWKDTRP